MKRSFFFSMTVMSLLGWSCNPEPPQTQEIEWSAQDREQLIYGLSNIHDSLKALSDSLTEDQWNFRPDSVKWSIGEVVIHLALHDALYFREIKSTTSLPAPLLLPDSLIDDDHYLMDYAEINPGNTGSAPWYLNPRNHRGDKSQAINMFLETRGHFIEFVKTTDKDLRLYYSTNGRGRKPYRDLHQLTLVSIAHARRHLQQISSIRAHSNFPKP